MLNRSPLISAFDVVNAIFNTFAKHKPRVANLCLPRYDSARDGYSNIAGTNIAHFWPDCETFSPRKPIVNATLPPKMPISYW